MDKRLIEILVCPVCKGDIAYHAEQKEFVCPRDKLAFPVKEEIPVMLPDAARVLSQEEADALK